MKTLSCINILMGLLVLVIWWFEIQISDWIPGTLVVIFTVLLFVSCIYLFCDVEDRLLLLFSILINIGIFVMMVTQSGEIFERSGKYGIRESIRHKEIYAPTCDSIIKRTLIGKAYEDWGERNNMITTEEVDILFLRIGDRYGAARIDGTVLEELIPVCFDSICILRKFITNPIRPVAIHTLQGYLGDSVRNIDCYGRVPGDTLETKICPPDYSPDFIPPY